MAIRYLSVANKTAALTRSAAIATAEGCGKNVEDVTRFWFQVIEHPVSRLGALVLDSAEQAKLTAGERSGLIDQSTAATAGWFPAREAKLP